jgi:vacuolar-type H+-ATPase subunit E/Vma4
MPARVVGDPERIVEQVIEEFRSELEKRIAEALEASRSVLEKAYDEAVRTLERDLNEKLRSLEERLRSAEATREVELRRELAKLRAAKVEEVLREALEKLSSYVPRDRYEKFLERLLREAKERSGGRAKIVPVERDREIVTRLAKKLGLEVSGETRDGYGGFIAITPDGVVLDYTLDKVLGEVIDKARAVISQQLFGAQA